MRVPGWCLMMVALAALLAVRPAMAQEAHDAEASAAAEGGGHGAHEDLGHGNATGAMTDVSALAGDLAIYTFVVFLLLLAILSRAAWPKISEALLAREKRIEGDLAAAAAKHEEAKGLLAQHEARLASAAAEVRIMLEEARRDADATKEQIIAAARAAAGQERERAVRDIDTAADHAMKRLAETSANLAVDLAGKVLQENINPAKHQELVRTALSKLNAANPSNN